MQIVQLIEASLADKLEYFLTQWTEEEPFLWDDLHLGWSSFNLVLSDVHHNIFLYEETIICRK